MRKQLKIRRGSFKGGHSKASPVVVDAQSGFAEGVRQRIWHPTIAGFQMFVDTVTDHYLHGKKEYFNSSGINFQLGEQALSPATFTLITPSPKVVTPPGGVKEAKPTATA